MYLSNQINKRTMRMLIDGIILLASLYSKCQIIFTKHNSLACILYKIEIIKTYMNYSNI